MYAGRAVWDDITRELVNEIKRTRRVAYVTSSGSHIRIRCPKCGDSKKNPTHAHLYIKLEAPYPFYCQRCQGTGILLNQENLNSFEVKDSNLKKELYKIAKHNKKKFSSYAKKVYNFSYPTYDEKDKINQRKLAYLNDRIGTSFTMKDLSRFKIILNLYDFLNHNNVQNLSIRDDEFADLLDEFFIGFHSYDNNYIIMRNTSQDVLQKTRYYNYNILNNYDNSKRFYIIPNQINVLNKKVKVVMAEGIFDILSIYHNIYNCKDDNTIFVAVCGVGYNNVILNLAKQGFLEMDLEIYADKDQPLVYYKKLKEDLSYLLGNQRIKVHYNKMEKDFGVTKDKIDYTNTTI